MAERDTSIIVGDIVNKHYKLIRQIYKGERGVIFCALDTSMNQVAIKFEKIAEEQPQICVESAILKLLAGTSCIPQFIHYGSYKNYKYLAMELIGPNLIDLVNYKRPYKFSLNSILKFGIQAIEALQVFHSKGFVHRDIKPV
ncbi:MAG: putative Casein kinase I [Streblomastix strix]|uniref:Putative Casein kinase I n=1 Tax=Streblomastix strix TaxID=222440 RepID=A0A5J4UDF8_9EUKA|nr:MAG: putative Casein kinase I [Streblomastix strix]